MKSIMWITPFWFDGSFDTLVITGQCPNKHRMAN